jgi:hypothetical protein
MGAGQYRQRPQPRRRAGQLRGALKRRRRRLVIVKVPVIDEAQIHHVLPAARLRSQTLLEKGDREVGAARPARKRLPEEDRAEPVRNAEVRIQIRRQVEQRIQQRVRARVSGGRETLLAEVLQRADPVRVRGDPVVVEDHARHDRRRPEVHEPRAIDLGRGPPILRRVEGDGTRQADRCGRAGRRAACPERGRRAHLKSLREKIATAPNNSAEMYSAAYAEVDTM